jgi:hypothetical protein
MLFRCTKTVHPEIFDSPFALSPAKRGIEGGNGSLRTGLWFDKLTMIGLNPFALSLSKGKLSTNGRISSVYTIMG